MQYFHILFKKVTYHDIKSSKEMELILKIRVLHIIAVVKGIVFFLNISAHSLRCILICLLLNGL